MREHVERIRTLASMRVFLSTKGLCSRISTETGQFGTIFRLGIPVAGAWAARSGIRATPRAPVPGANLRTGILRSTRRVQVNTLPARTLERRLVVKYNMAAPFTLVPVTTSYRGHDFEMRAFDARSHFLRPSCQPCFTVRVKLKSRGEACRITHCRVIFPTLGAGGVIEARRASSFPFSRSQMQVRVLPGPPPCSA
jgi:hypothetical protein